MGPSTSGGPPQVPLEIASLAERMGYMQALRAGLAATILASSIFASDIVGVQIAGLVGLTVAYLLLTIGTEAIRLLFQRRGLAIVTTLLLIDGVYLAWAMYLSGGPLSPLRFLVFVHIIGVTLLASQRTGLKIALWHSLLTFVILYAQIASFLPSDVNLADSAGATRDALERLSVFNVTAFWIVALATAAFSSINERELRRRQADLSTLAEMAAELEDVTEANAIAKIFLQKVCSALGFRRGIVLQTSENDSRLLARVGPAGAFEAELEAEPGPPDPLVQSALERHDTLLARELDPRTDPQLEKLLPGAQRVVVQPLFADGIGIGAVVMEHPGKSLRIERRVVSMLGQFSSHVALALRNAGLLEQVQHLAETDPLTGVANRRLFEFTLSRELHRANRNNDCVTLVMVDVDHFKDFNDTFGHQAGDRALQAVADALLEACREFDTVARYGGEEFAVILPGCSTKQSAAAAERLREAVAKVKVQTSITASAGVSTFPNNAKSASMLIRGADEALYQSKEAGRNRVTKSRRRGSADPEPLVSDLRTSA